jgi:hypothetical protein
MPYGRTPGPETFACRSSRVCASPFTYPANWYVRAAEQHGEVLGLMPGELDDGRVVRVRIWFSVCPAVWCHP